MNRPITEVVAWEALDSRGTPTVGCEVVVSGEHRGTAHVPSGASTGRHEARELRDGGDRYAGRGVSRAVAAVRGPLRAAVLGHDAGDQIGVDAALRAVDPELVGANAILAVSIATALAGSAATGRPLHEAAADTAGGAALLPMPMFNVLSGGAHAGGAVDVQDFLVIPVGADSFAQAVEWGWRVRRGTAAAAGEAGHPVALVADEGGLGLRLATNRQALDLLLTGCSRAALRPGDDVAFAVDVAASQLFDGDRYRLRAENRVLSAAELIGELAGWCDAYPIVSIEDPLAEDDWSGWAMACRELGDRVQLVGDDLFATNPARLARGIEERSANAVLVKPNQIGTLSDAHRVVRLARDAGFATILSARSGETEDSWLADLAVAWRTGQVKVGSLTRAERTAKWNRLLRLEQELGLPMADRHVLGLSAPNA